MRGCGHPASDLDKPCPWCRIAELERALSDAHDYMQGLRAEERERWTNVIAQVLRYTNLERVWGGMEWSYRSTHVKKINDICEEAIHALGNDDA